MFVCFGVLLTVRCSVLLETIFVFEVGIQLCIFQRNSHFPSDLNKVPPLSHHTCFESLYSISLILLFLLEPRHIVLIIVVILSFSI